jgi:hypothetical protein
MTSLLFRLRGRSPHNSPLVTGPRALAKALNQKGGRGRPSPLRIELAPSSPRPESWHRRSESAASAIEAAAGGRLTAPLEAATTGAITKRNGSYATVPGFRGD